MARSAADGSTARLTTSTALPRLQFLADGARIEVFLICCATAIACASDEIGRGVAWVAFIATVGVPIALIWIGVRRLWRRWEGDSQPRNRPIVLPGPGRSFSLLDSASSSLMILVLAWLIGRGSRSDAPPGFGRVALVLAIAIGCYFVDRWLAILSWRLGPHSRPPDGSSSERARGVR